MLNVTLNVTSSHGKEEMGSVLIEVLRPIPVKDTLACIRLPQPIAPNTTHPICMYKGVRHPLPPVRMCVVQV